MFYEIRKRRRILLFDEQETDHNVPGNVLWALTDNLGSVRDVVRHDTSAPDDIVIVSHTGT